MLSRTSFHDRGRAKGRMSVAQTLTDQMLKGTLRPLDAIEAARK
jgi:hypothetical protein